MCSWRRAWGITCGGLSASRRSCTPGRARFKRTNSWTATPSARCALAVQLQRFHPLATSQPLLSHNSPPSARKAACCLEARTPRSAGRQVADAECAGVAARRHGAERRGGRAGVPRVPRAACDAVTPRAQDGFHLRRCALRHPAPTPCTSPPCLPVACVGSSGARLSALAPGCCATDQHRKAAVQLIERTQVGRARPRGRCSSTAASRSASWSTSTRRCASSVRSTSKPTRPPSGAPPPRDLLRLFCPLAAMRSVAVRS